MCTEMYLEVCLWAAKAEPANLYELSLNELEKCFNKQKKNILLQLCGFLCSQKNFSNYSFPGSSV